MQNVYETVFILKPTLTDEETKARVQFILDTITNNGGEIEATHEIGTRRLAYKVDKYERGFYCVAYFKSVPETVKELERIYTITEDIIRFMTIKYENKKELAQWNKMVEMAKSIKQKAA
ncbi:MAG: 30S ribosomal protein S6 [Campylobacterales bacterium]|nr:30S ribosomal protein S6 [Campylobacterales bacterium]